MSNDSLAYREEGKRHMTRKDYELIAASLYSYARPHMDHNNYTALVHAFVDHLSEDNPKFQRALFEVACNHGTTVKQPMSVRVPVTRITPGGLKRIQR